MESESEPESEVSISLAGPLLTVYENMCREMAPVIARFVPADDHPEAAMQFGQLLRLGMIAAMVRAQHEVEKVYDLVKK